ncbi:hypothetical protein C4544_01520 [candidate division WS5 bacterium]|uniref:Uncharacterized protein n=1 Tax=candidate division WS5 bacterium TaxID=2093353 RepID=A0A419DFX7_9BACT|nr:MAG: hypothetical protein C4544_01520 [candidate division WS5 bacterium]
MKIFQDWRNFSIKADLLAYHLKTSEAEAFHAALNTVGKSMPVLPSRKLSDKLSNEELVKIREILRLGITLGILPVKVPATWKECRNLFNTLETSGCDAAEGVVIQALWSELYHFYGRHPQFKRIEKSKKAKMPLANVWEHLPKAVEVSIRAWVQYNVLDPFKVLDFEAINKP